MQHQRIKAELEVFRFELENWKLFVIRHIDALTSILRLKNEIEFTWGAEQQEVFEKIKVYLSSTPVLKAPRRGVPFRLYVAAEDKVIGAVLTQETEEKEHIITYIKPTTY